MEYTEEFKDEVWNKAREIDGYDSTIYRQDACGAWIAREAYDDRDSPFGWEIDHIYPESKLKVLGVPDTLINHPLNLRPLNWMNNVSKGNDYPSYQAKVKAVGNRNISGEFQLIVNGLKRDEIEELYKGYL